MSEKVKETPAINKHGERISLRVQVHPLDNGKAKEFANVGKAAEYFMESGISQAKNISSVIYNLESAIRGYELRDVRPCNRQTAYDCVITRQYNI